MSQLLHRSPVLRPSKWALQPVKMHRLSLWKTKNTVHFFPTQLQLQKRLKFCTNFAYWIGETAWNCHHHHRRPSRVCERLFCFAMKQEDELFLLKKKKRNLCRVKRKGILNQRELSRKHQSRWLQLSHPRLAQTHLTGAGATSLGRERDWSRSCCPHTLLSPSTSWVRTGGQQAFPRPFYKAIASLSSPQTLMLKKNGVTGR